MTICHFKKKQKCEKKSHFFLIKCFPNGNKYYICGVLKLKVMNLQKETVVQTLLVHQTIKQIEARKKRLDEYWKELNRLEDLCFEEIKADFEKGAWWKSNFEETAEKGTVEITTEKGYVFDFTYLIDPENEWEIIRQDDCVYWVNTLSVEVDGESHEINFDGVHMDNLLQKYYTHENT